MAVSRLLFTFALVAICIGLSVGRPRRGRGRGGDRGGHPEKHRPNKLKEFTCKLEKDGVVLFDKKCGCGNETDPGVTCSLGPLTVPKDDQTVVTFCNIRPDWPKENPWRGMLGAACKISVGDETLKEKSCGSHDNGTDIPCTLGPLSVTFNETISAEVFFCQRPAREESEESGAEGGEDEPEEPEEEQEKNCVPLDRKPKGHKGGKSGSTDNSELDEGPEAVAVEGGADDGQTGGDGRQRPEGQGRRDQDRRPGNPEGQESDRQGEGRDNRRGGRRGHRH